MFAQENTFIIVDDVDDHLNTLSKRFHDNGIGCRALKYDVFYSTPLKGIKVAFFDININPSGGGSNQQIFNSLATGLKQYIHVDNGPFALIFWTSNTSLIESFKKYVNSRRKDLPVPFMVNCIDKDRFLDTENNLEDKIKQVLNDKILDLLFDFKTCLNSSSDKTIKKIYDIIPKSDNWGYNQNFTRDFELVFSKIAASTLGYEHAKKYPDKAIYEALSQVLTHDIVNTNNSNKWLSFLTSLQNSTSLKDIAKPLKFKESELNSIFHIDNLDLKKDARGVVLSIRKNEKKISKIFNKSYSDWVKSFIPLKSEFKAAEREASEKQISNCIKSSKLIAIEISSACDYSQNKHRLNKYLYGVVLEKIDDKLLQKKIAPDSSFEVGTFLLDNKELNIWVNFNYIFSALPTDSQLGKPLFSLKKEIMDMVGNRYANHISRIGITSF